MKTQAQLSETIQRFRRSLCMNLHAALTVKYPTAQRVRLREPVNERTKAHPLDDAGHVQTARFDRARRHRAHGCPEVT